MEYEGRAEIYVKKILAGGIDEVRLQLIEAAESVGYDIIEDEPNIIARREARGWATWVFSANVLDFARTLTIRLKSVSDTSTQATFDYSFINHGMGTGAKQIVLQEAKTIAAISKMQAVEKLCSVCETESTDDSRFCRKCGAPLTSEQAEIEVLRIMAETRAGKISVNGSAIALTVSTVLLTLTFILNNAGLLKEKLFPLFLILGSAGVLYSIISIFFGLNRLRRALDVPETKVPHIPRSVPDSLNESSQKELPPQTTAPASITEGTTNLLDEGLLVDREKEKVPISRKRVTNDLD